MIKFAESKLDPKNYKIFHFNIIKYLTKKLSGFYNVIGT